MTTRAVGATREIGRGQRCALSVLAFIAGLTMFLISQRARGEESRGITMTQKE